MFCTICRQVMDTLAFLPSRFQIGFNFLERAYFRDTGSFALFFQSRLRAHPYDCVDGQFVTENDLFVVVYINDGG